MSIAVFRGPRKPGRRVRCLQHPQGGRAFSVDRIHLAPVGRIAFQVSQVQCLSFPAWAFIGSPSATRQVQSPMSPSERCEPERSGGKLFHPFLKLERGDGFQRLLGEQSFLDSHLIESPGILCYLFRLLQPGPFGIRGFSSPAAVRLAGCGQ